MGMRYGVACRTAVFLPVTLEKGASAVISERSVFPSRPMTVLPFSTRMSSFPVERCHFNNSLAGRQQSPPFEWRVNSR